MGCPAGEAGAGSRSNMEKVLVKLAATGQDGMP